MNTKWRIVAENCGLNDDGKASYLQPTTAYLESSANKQDDNWTMHEGANYRAYHYAVLQKAIQTMVSLPEGASYRLDAETGKTALQWLAIFKNNYSVQAPKLLPHDVDVLALTWVNDCFKTLLTIESDEIDLLKVDLQKRTNEYIDLDGEDGDALKKIVYSLSAQAKVASL